jgi:tetratricopeptide (TPR) repeat protein
LGKKIENAYQRRAHFDDDYIPLVNFWREPQGCRSVNIPAGSKAIIHCMSRTAWRVITVLLVLLVAVVVPIIVNGYSELNKTTTAASYPEVAGHYLRAAQRLPWRPDLYELAGHAYYHAEDYLSADEMYRIALDHDALSPAGWVAWGDVNYLNGDHTGAANIWRTAFGHGNVSDALYSRLAEVYQQEGDYSLAAQFLQKYVTTRPADAPAHYRLGLLLTLSDPSSALSELSTASQQDLQFDPSAQTLRSALNLALVNDSPSGRYVIIGNGLGLVNEWKLALAAFESAVQADESNAEAWAWLGEAKQQNGGAGSAELDRALALNPNSSTVRALRGLYFQRTGNFRQALIEYQTAATLDPQNPERYFSLGDTFALNGDLIRGLESYQYAVTLAPDNAATWRALARFCAQNNVHVRDVGIPAAQRALILAGDSISEDLLGWLWLLDGSPLDAERHFLRALELDSQYAPAHFHLGMTYLQTGDRTRAFDYLIRARDLGSSEADVFIKQYFP